MSPAQEFPKYRVAAVQAGPVFREAPEWFDLTATLDKAVRLIEEAGKNGARLVVFPETWLPCYPYFSLDLEEKLVFREMWARYLWHSVEVPSPETDALCAAAKRANANVVMGINERDRDYRARMYNSVLYISAQGEILGTHRKICNTVHERLFHTPGDGGDNLKTVFKTDIGRIGGSICGEHEQLPMVYYWIMQGMEVHCSLWPGTAGMETVVDVLSRSVALNARCFGVIAAAYLADKDHPKSFFRNSLIGLPNRFRGGSAVVGPSGEYVTRPVYDKETIVYGDIDLADVDRCRYAVNLAGIYSRWDLININVRQQPYPPVQEMAAGNALLQPGAGMLSDLERRLGRLEEQLAAARPARIAPVKKASSRRR